jgi:hypothetical protein
MTRGCWLPTLATLAVPMGLVACGGSSPPPPVVVTTPPPVVTAPPPTIVVPPMPVAVDRNGMIAQCQGLFAQSLTGQTVTYGAPTADTIGDVTTVHLTASISGPAVGVNPHQYTCTFSRGQLTNAVPR